ncbi:MAG: hypothetical protein ACXWJM_05955 [Ramlibacter sp.]
MRIVMVRYKVRPDAAAENQRLIGEVFAQLQRDKPAGMRYQVYKLPDGVSFMHVGASEAGGAEGNPLVKLEAFKAFIAGVKDRCDEQPVTVELQALGAYDSLG